MRTAERDRFLVAFENIPAAENCDIIAVAIPVLLVCAAKTCA